DDVKILSRASFSNVGHFSDSASGLFSLAVEQLSLAVWFVVRLKLFTSLSDDID
ncbi:5543_t:CDS:2, partial [Cetraspora pellucida]